MKEGETPQNRSKIDQLRGELEKITNTTKVIKKSIKVRIVFGK